MTANYGPVVGQKAFVALEVERILAEEAKKRQGTRTDLDTTLLKDFNNVDSRENESREKAAQIIGTNQHYVTEVVTCDT